jgi:hypothetical protein
LELDDLLQRGDEPVPDQDGHYLEVIHRAAFNKTLADNGTRFGVFYNHGLRIHGTPSSRFSMPLGVPLEVKADAKGLFTRTRYGGSELADAVVPPLQQPARSRPGSRRFEGPGRRTPMPARERITHPSVVYAGQVTSISPLSFSSAMGAASMRSQPAGL